MEVEWKRARREMESVDGGVTDNKNKDCPFNRLPDECLFEVFSYNPDPSGRWWCAAVCKRWLLLQAHMKRSDFKVESPGQHRARGRMKRCLEGGQAVDTRLAAIAVRKWARGIVGDLSIRGDYLEEEGEEEEEEEAQSPSSSTTKPPSPTRRHGVLTDCGLDIVGSGFPCLKSLALWGCLCITNKGLVCVSRGCALLEKLDLCECPLITDEGMVAVARGLKRLTTLSLESCRNIGNSSLKALGANTPSLHSISVRGCRLVGDEGVFAILAGLPNLKRLRLAQIRSNMQAVLAIVRHCKALTSLSLEGYSFAIGSTKIAIGTDADNRDGDHNTYKKGADLRQQFEPPNLLSNMSSFRAIGRECANLKSVTINQCIALNDEGLIELGRGVVALEKLSLEACQCVSLDGLVGFLAKHAKNLKNLSLLRCNAILEPKRRCELGLNSPPSCNKLENLTLGWSQGLLIDAFLAWLGRVSCHLREIELIGLRDVSDLGVASLLMGSVHERRDALDRVNFNGCSGLTDSSILVVSRSFGSELRSLCLSECPRMTSQSLKAIAFYCSELRDLDVSGNEIKDRDLGYLNKMVWLTNLNLKGCSGLSKKAITSFEERHFECDLVY